MTIELTTRQRQLIDGLAEDLKPLVKDIESGIATTQHNYARYGHIIAQFAMGNKTVANVIALALIQAGANSLGVTNGLKLFN